MNILLVGDAFISAEQFSQKSNRLKAFGHTVEIISWGPDDRSELENIIRKMEKGIIIDDDSLLEVKEKVIGKDAIFVDFCPVPASIVNRVKLIGVTRSGTSNVDMKSAKEANIPVLQIEGRNAVAVAEFTIGLMLSVSRNISYAHHAMMQGYWKKSYAYEPVELEGKRIGLVGFGEIGRCVARKLATMGCEVVFFDPFYHDENKYAKTIDFEDLIRTSDFISLHVKLSEETTNLISRREFELMKSSAFIINTARAEIIDSKALIEALRTHKIAGAALDVFPEEPIPDDDPLLSLDNVVITSHIAGSTPEALIKSVDLLFDKFIRFNR
jgi:D-3-phosphoglycerate dehydrogenase